MMSLYSVYQEHIVKALEQIYPNWVVHAYRDSVSDSLFFSVSTRVEVDYIDFERNRDNIPDLIDKAVETVDQNILKTEAVTRALSEKDKKIKELEDLLKNVKIIAENEANKINNINDPLAEVRDAVKGFNLK